MILWWWWRCHTRPDWVGTLWALFIVCVVIATLCLYLAGYQ